MKLLLAGRAGARTLDWSGYAFLRDNVQHFVEAGAPSARFTALHAIEAAVDGHPCRVDAARLRGEVLRACYALAGVAFEDAAVSLRTRAILTGSCEHPTKRGTVTAKQVGWSVPSASENAMDVTEEARRFIAAVLSLTDRAVDGDELEVRLSGAPPRFVPRPTPGMRNRWHRQSSLPSRALKALGVSALVFACGAVQPRPAEPSRCDERTTTNDERREREAPEQLVAPPPAYGNKVVRTERSGSKPAPSVEGTPG